jgi:predicted nucleic acid-binding protein
MAMTSGKAFLDTNILLRSTVTQFPSYAQAKQLVDAQFDAGVELWISRQVIREYIAQVTRPQVFMNPMTMDEVDAKLRTIRVLFKIADDTEEVTTQLLALMKVYPTGGKQVHDANVVATMLVNGIDMLLTTNVEDMKRFADRITILSLENVK